MSTLDNIRKTIAYARRNGPAAAWTAAMERMRLNRIPYTYEAPSGEAVRAQRAAFSRRVMEAQGKRMTRFSVITPLYLTPKPFLAEMIASVKNQSYGEWELVCADASPQEKNLRYAVEQEARDARVLYLPLAKNGGISENTNRALARASGDYVVLLDHDDLLTPDALYVLEEAIAGYVLKNGTLPLLVYSDEDKFEDPEKGKRRYFEPHRKPDFDFDRLLTNNYICHVAVVRADVAKRLRLRAAYDGSQDYDLFLRVCAEAVAENGTSPGILHVPRVLYHWRSHSKSTSVNPGSKDYAYEAGKRVIEDALLRLLNGTGAVAEVTELAHHGFYRVTYTPDVFAARPDVGAVGGKVTDRNGTITGGKTVAAGNVFYEGLPAGHSGGYQHDAALVQEADAVDLRCVYVRQELYPLYLQYGAVYDAGASVTAEEMRARSLAFSEAVRARGFRILWDPAYEACAL
ncbi:MAG: glycosyltransferase [Lachnospiraceae bacterium]|nr:glycosyltransferase [Lachnospiraceae bacterium]